MEANTTGSGNTAFGDNALTANTTGANNIAIGDGAGQAVTTGSYNIEVGIAGAATDSKAIRIGTQGTQTTAYFAGIYGSTVKGDAVLVTSAGKLGMVMSSARYKRDIRDMGSRSGGLLKLRPVTFRYKERSQWRASVRPGGGGSRESLSGTGELWSRWQTDDGALPDAQRDAAQRVAEAGQ